MSLIIHPATGFAVGDPDVAPLRSGALPSPAEIESAARGLILSASGWRKIFAAGGDEESPEPAVAAADIALAGAAAIVLGEFLIARSGRPDPALLVGLDSRPTGPVLADAMIRVFQGMGLRPRYLFIVAAPELMAYARRAYSLPADHEERGEGFCYISASHNPRGHNGLKFGAASPAAAGAARAAAGGVLSAAEMRPLIESFRSLARDPGLGPRLLELMAAADPRAIARIYSECSMLKRRSISAYTLFAHEVVTGRAEPAAQAALLEEMAQGAIRRPVGVVAELNGSARCLSIDRDFLEGLGLEVRAVNDKPRQFAHRIVPEGESLDQCRTALEAAAADDPAFVAGYVPDCDGDRGNLVRFDAASASARPIEAQEVFALACVAELASLVRDGALGYDESGNAKQKVAVVVNDATSMRVNAIARAFDVDVYRSETGEANVVGLAAELRAKGYVVRILGEGSNGGNITHPSSVRDPLATLGALLKLLLLRGSEVGGDDGGGEGLFRIWMRLSGRLANYRPEFDLGDIVASLPAYATTSVFEARAALKVASYDQASLKARYATLFLREWESRKAELASRFGAVSWEAFATRGTAETRVGSDFAASGTGGLRIALADGSGRPVAFLWMRASGTEPVFRIMADVEGGRAEDEAYLLAWHESMVRGADRAPLAESGGIS